MYRLMGESFSSLAQSPIQTPAVIGWQGSTSRAQTKAFFSSASARSALFSGSDFP